MGSSELLDAADVRTLARLHHEVLPESAFSLLGQQALEVYYRRVAFDPEDQIFLERRGGRIVGGCVLSYNPGSLAKRTLRHRPWIVAVSIIRAFLRSGLMRRKLWDNMRSETSLPKGGEGLPEVVQIFADPKYRNMKVGTRLLAKVEAHLDGKPYFLKTEQSEENPAIHFYLARGFEPFGTADELGKRYLYFKKIG